MRKVVDQKEEAGFGVRGALPTMQPVKNPNGKWQVGFFLRFD
jgi:hypothetical protein